MNTPPDPTQSNVPRIAVRRSSGMVEYLTPDEFDKLNERKRKQPALILRLYRQRNAAMIAAGLSWVITLLLSGYIYFFSDAINKPLQTNNNPLPVDGSTHDAGSPAPRSIDTSSVIPLSTLDTEIALIKSITDSPSAGTSPTLPAPKNGDSSTKNTGKTQKINTSEVNTNDLISAATHTLLDWANAWSNQNIDSYLRHYSSNFTPSKSLSHAQWISQRQSRIRQPKWIEVTLSNIDLEITTPKQIQAVFTQAYRSNNFSDTDKKQIVFVLENEKWKILQEDTVK